jgi:hypothetical protein
MDKLVDGWRVRREQLKAELASIESKNDRATVEIDEHKEVAGATTEKLAAHLRSRIAELDALIGAKRGSRDN